MQSVLGYNFRELSHVPILNGAVQLFLYFPLLNMFILFLLPYYYNIVHVV